MSDGLEFLLTQVVSFFVGLAVNETSTALLKGRENKLLAALQDEERLQQAISSRRSLPDELAIVCNKLAQNRFRPRSVPPHEFPLWKLLTEKDFQADLAAWFMAGDIEEGVEIKVRLAERMKEALAGADPQQAATLRQDYFTALDRAIFSSPLLANWRLQLRTDYLQTRLAEAVRLARENAGNYSAEKRRAALDRYCEQALAAWDIIDLATLPVEDIQIATQKLLLRQLYVPLRIDIEGPEAKANADELLARLETRRDQHRRREAGYLAPDEAEAPVERRVTVGQQLAASNRLVVLGDPGGGKTTMMRWMATAYLLRHRGDDAFRYLPDTETLPDEQWIPVLICCRDLGREDLSRSFDDFLTQHLKKTAPLPEEAAIMRAVILERIANGRALLLVDGLDEISDPQVRVMFCKELERTAACYPDAPIVVTSRVVGYRDMPYRMRSGFEHGQIAELSVEDKDHFAQRWVEVTEQHFPQAERARRAQELQEALHSSDRIERLTGNPMLLTTLALVKRKVGRLPNRRSDLYAEAVAVLLNWNVGIYKAIDKREAIPQLEYLAYEMCRQGVQRLPEDEVLTLLVRMREEYPNVWAVRERSPQEFLKALEERSSLVIQTGSIRKKKRKEEPVWEFRHLTFQEYLAAQALLHGKYPERDKGVTLAEQVSRLAATTQQDGTEPMVSDAWREALRLVVADCRDDDVDDVLCAILRPRENEHGWAISRPRAVLAALALADEPNVGEEASREVVQTLPRQIFQKHEGDSSQLTLAALALARGPWAQLLRECLTKEFWSRPPYARSVASVLAMTNATILLDEFKDPALLSRHLAACLQSGDRESMFLAALAIMHLAYTWAIKTKVHPKLDGGALAPGLLKMLKSESGLRLAAAWALLWLGKSYNEGRSPWWIPSAGDIEAICIALEHIPEQEDDTRHFLVGAMLDMPFQTAESVAKRLLRSEYRRARQASIQLLLRSEPTAGSTRVLLSETLGGGPPWLDPAEAITTARIDAAAHALQASLEETRTLYESIAPHYHLTFA